MTTAKEKTPARLDAEASKNWCDSEQKFTTFNTTENALLKALIWCPARLILDVASGLEEQDFFNEHARIIYREILRVAHDLDVQGYDDYEIHAGVIRNALKATGCLNDPLDAFLLSITATGDPAPIPPTVHRLAQDLRVERLRRALDTAGRELIVASQDSHDHILVAIGRTQHLQALARRAGVERQAGEHV
ncbi:hypothetical protein CSTAT_09690 [Corynebacterium stationis]|uniref:hypothetical protein n=1 Tax=Corynebacterium stationis TaxID=1705 RepID=UPI0009506F4C|nr:hypothetical protein [Corynebacterium stationis]APT95554.1 hypothetical protein CSTAT_09690 [Corynebacterium stationis]